MKIQNKNAEIKISIKKYDKDIRKDNVEFWNPYNREWVNKPRDVISCHGYMDEDKIDALKEIIYFLETQNKLWKI
jgi:hypothetical protein